MSKIVQVEERNDWERRTHYAGGEQLTPENTRSVYIQWPTGVQEIQTVLWERETHTYSDHGKEGSATSHVPYIRPFHYGHRLRIPLTGLDILK